MGCDTTPVTMNSPFMLRAYQHTVEHGHQNQACGYLTENPNCPGVYTIKAPSMVAEDSRSHLQIYPGGDGTKTLFAPFPGRMQLHVLYLDATGEAHAIARVASHDQYANFKLPDGACTICVTFAVSVEAAIEKLKC